MLTIYDVGVEDERVYIAMEYVEAGTLSKWYEDAEQALQRAIEILEAYVEHFRAMPVVRRGAFASSSDTMYMFAFLGLWGVALLTRSQAAIAVALFQHAYIWVRWYCTEQPDGVVLYGRSQDEAGT